MSSETKPEGSEAYQVKLKDIARLIGVEAGQIQVETPSNLIKDLVPKVDTIRRSSKKAGLYLLIVWEGTSTIPRERALEEFGRFVTVPVAVWRAHEAGSVREGDALVYVPGEEEGERVYHFRVTGELLEAGERSDPGEQEVAVKVKSPKKDERDRSGDLWTSGTEEYPPRGGPNGHEEENFTSTPRRRRRRMQREDGGPGEA